MFKRYQIKWYLILVGIIATSSLLLRREQINVFWYHYIYYVLRIASLIAVCWFINGYFMLNDFFWKNRYVKLFLGIFLSIVVTYVLIYIFSRYLPKNPLDGESNFHAKGVALASLGASFYISLICYVIFYSGHTNTVLQDTKLKNELLQQAHLRAQLISLQQQLSPHFLFNSLSTLKTIAKDQPTKKYVLQLASVYRYVLSFNENHMAKLSEEIDFINAYLYIMEQRFGNAIKVSFNIDGEKLDWLIPSMSLQLLVENAIKHNKASLDFPLNISILTSGEALTVENDFLPKSNPEEGTGMGLRNISERCRLLMDKSIEIDQDKEKFRITVPLLSQ